MSTPPTFVLSDEQEKILQATGNIVVVAGAGTGKTETLTQRVLHLLETIESSEKGALALHEFVALTFTDKAAGEMRQRIYQSLLRKLVGAKGETERARWRALSSGFAESNRVGTFDAFNNRLLAAYPEYQVAPSHFRPMTAYDERELQVKLSRAFWYWIEGLELHDPLREDAFELLEQFERKQLIPLIGDLAREESHHLAALAAPIGKEDFQRELEKIASQAALRIERRARRKIEVLWRKWENFVRANFELPPALQAILLSEAELQTQFDEIFTTQTTFRKKWIEAEWKELCAEIEALALPLLKDWRAAEKSLEKHLSSLRETGAMTDVDWRGRCLLGAAARLAQWWSTRRTELCNREGWLDFTGVQRAALDLLENHPEVANRLKTGTRFLMVDEFQDTNFAQWRLVDAIRDADNVMLIGDGKQSIYGFRGGDITVFDEVREKHLENYQTLPLSVSQRATPNLTTFFNALFQEILPAENAEREAWEAPFQELHSAREANSESGVTVLSARQESAKTDLTEDSPDNSSDDLQSDNRETNSGEIADLFHADDESVWPLIAQAQSETEALAETTALFLREIQDDADAIRLRIGDSENTQNADDYEFLQPKFESVARKIATEKAGVIGVLFRTHAVKATFENALRRHHVRHASVKGIGFYQSQPVFDAINILGFLFDAHDSRAVAGVLRAPLVGASDLALLELRRVQVSEKCESLWAALETRCAQTLGAEYSLSDADEFALQKGFARMKSWREMARAQLISAVLETIWNETELAFSEAMQEDSAQRRQNWHKVLDIVREREEQSRGSARALAEYFIAQAESGEKEADAELPEGGAIQLMTVHAAKGLGFEMTIVAQMNGTFHMESPLWRKGALENRDEIFYAINLDSEENEDVSGKPGKEKSLLWTILLEEARAREESEFARLFYVACTRARDFLVLAMPEEPKKNSWAEMANGLLGDKATLVLPDLQARAKSRENAKLDLSIEQMILPDSVFEPPINTAFLQPFTAQLGRETSVTELLKFHQTESGEKTWSTPDATDTAERMRQSARDPRLHGEVFHRLLRVVLEKKMVGEENCEGSCDESLVARFCRLSGLPIERTAILKSQIEAALRWMKSQNFDLSCARSEVGFSIPSDFAREEYSQLSEETQWINGVIDLIIPGENGLAIVDFKTHSGSDGLENLMRARGYDQQVLLYRRACEYSGLDVSGSWIVFLDEMGNAAAFPV